MQTVSSNYNDALKYLETISSYGDITELDSTYRVMINKAIILAKNWQAKGLDSINCSEFLYHSGRLYSVKRVIDSARIDLEQSLEYNIKNVRALERLSQLATFHLKGYTKRKAYINRCVAACKTSLASDSSRVRDWERMAEAYYLQMIHNLSNNHGLISACYRKCIQLDPGNHYYYFELAMNTTGKEKEDALRKALSIKELWLYRSHLIALYAYEYKRYEEALQLIDETILLYESASPRNNSFMSTLYYYKAEIYKRQKKMDLYKICKTKSKEYSDLD